MTPTARTLTKLRQQGYVAAVVEKWIPRMRRRVDLFGCIDILAYKTDVPGVLGVQATTGKHAAARLEKAKAEARMQSWLVAGMGRRFEVWGWRKIGPRGKRKRWEASVAALFDGALTGLTEQGETTACRMNGTPMNEQK